MVGGMGVRVTLTWQQGPGGEARIGDMGFRVFASAAPLAPASLLVERAVGRTGEEAGDLEPGDLVRGLLDGGADVLPRAVHRGAIFAIDALRCALGLPLFRPSDPEGPGVLVCRCLSVGDRQIADVIRCGATTPEAVGDACGAGTGCRSCRPDLLVLIHDARLPPPAVPPADLHPVARIAFAHVAPVLAAGGLELRDARVTDDDLHLDLARPTPNARLRAPAARSLARSLLREIVAEDLEVTVAESE